MGIKLMPVGFKQCKPANATPDAMSKFRKPWLLQDRKFGGYKRDSHPGHLAGYWWRTSDEQRRTVLLPALGVRLFTT